MTALRGLVVQIDQRLVLGQDDRVDPAVVVEVARGQAPTQMERARTDRRRGPTRRSDASVRSARQQLDGHLPGEGGPVVADMAVGGDQVEPAVVVGVEEGDAEAQQRTRGRGQADAAVWSANSPRPRLWKSVVDSP